MSIHKLVADRSIRKMDITVDKTSKLDKTPSGLRRAPSLKENLKHPVRDIASQSKDEKTGKSDSQF